MNITLPRLKDSFTFTSKQTLKNELSRTRNDYRSLFNNVAVGIIRTDIQKKSIIKINQAALDMLQYQTLEQLQNVSLCKLYNNQNDYYKHSKQLRRKGRISNFKLQLKRYDGSLVTVIVNSVIHFENGIALWVDTSIQDVTNQNNIQEKMYKLAHFDALTQLSNRYAFMQQLEACVESAQRYNRQAALLFIDLDGFKQINDTYGHKSGDAVLIEIANRFTNVVRKSDTVSRMGGDEFTILIPEYSGVHDIAGLAQKIVTTASQAIELNNATVHVSASIGISLYPHDGKSSDLLLSSADNAMYYAKELGKNNYQFFSKELNIESVNRLIFEMELKNAIERDELTVDFQPRIDTHNHTIVALDAHIRWNSPDFGEVDASEFIPVAESCQFIKELGLWEIKESLHHMKLWQKIEGYSQLRLSITLSCEHLNDTHFIQQLQHLLEDTHYNPKLLEFSIHERALAKNSTHPMLQSFRDLGVHISIHNFGSAASSFDVFDQLQPTTVTLDATLSTNIHTQPSQQKKLHATQGIAHVYNFNIVVKEVTSPTEQDWLTQNNFHVIQGPLYTKPLSIEDVSNYLVTFN